MTSSTDEALRIHALEELAEAASEEGSITEVIRPAAILPEMAARIVVKEFAKRDVRSGGCWLAEPACWRRYDRPWDGSGGTPGRAQLIGSLQVAYGTPTRYEITIFRATVTSLGATRNWNVQLLCDEALSFGGLSLATCPRADLTPPPPPFRLR